MFHKVAQVLQGQEIYGLGRFKEGMASVLDSIPMICWKELQSFNSFTTSSVRVSRV